MYLLQMVRNERFNEEYQSEVRSVVELVSTHIVQRYKENPVEARAANNALAHFLKVKDTDILSLQPSLFAKIVLLNKELLLNHVIPSSKVCLP